MKFSEIRALPDVAERFAKIRRWFFLRESTYDMTRRCNIRCHGCYYYEGDKQHAVDNTDPAAWRALLTAEKERGITFVVLAGAEPALVPDLLQACYDVIPLGAIATNGIKKIPESVGYRIHVSVWGSEETSRRYRGNPCLPKQIENYAGDPRAVFVYTFTPENVDEAEGVVQRAVEADIRLTFNQFSPTVGYQGDMRFTPATLARVRETAMRLIREYPDHVIYSDYNAEAHTDVRSLHERYRCPYPRVNPNDGYGLGRSFRQYRSDLTWDRDAACCVPDTDCAECRHYAAGSAVVTARMLDHADSAESFRKWLDYVDTYLSVWVTGYERGKPLYWAY
jgi:MoaA/NifB/PqqE/SkfB family radical SAM enzyme